MARLLAFQNQILSRLLLRIVGRLSWVLRAQTVAHRVKAGVGQSSRKEIAGEGRLSYGDLGAAWWWGFIEYEHVVRGERLRVYWFVTAHEFMAH